VAVHRAVIAAPPPFRKDARHGQGQQCAAEGQEEHEAEAGRQEACRQEMIASGRD
jgi:hypothetical protein